MRFTLNQAMLSGLLLAGSTTTAASSPPKNHPSVEMLAKFSPHFRCPYSNEWINSGPEQAAINLGLVNATTSVKAAHSSVRGGRRSLSAEDVSGSCTYTNTWTNAPSCLEFRGSTWTETAMTERCAGESDSTMTMSSPCQVEPGLGGYCVVVGADGTSVEATPLAGMDCTMAQTTCENFMSGSFEKAEGCGQVEGGPPTPPSGGEGGFPYAVQAPSEPVSCAIAPGAIGAAHQAAYSTGYGENCEGTPAQGSPYMWPSAWSAHVESKSMAFGSDDVLYHSKGYTYYRMDKNWKRNDWYYQRGVQRSVGQAPCPEEDNETEEGGPMMSCRRDSDDYRTMIHRGSKMMFIDWKNDTEVGSSDPNQIESCYWLDMRVVGNVRNDWFMDNRGDSTGVQYLGDQHVYYEGVPRLVKQWRKKDFANQYFVMSVQANPKEDGMHWPMILNVPGEGFGDDFLQIYQNQTLLTDDDDYMFWLDEALEEIGGSCDEMKREGGGGPPTDGVHIPSNLEVEPNAWFENVYTFSPVWEPPAPEDDKQSMTTGANGMATTQEGDITVHSCYDATTNSVELNVEFSNFEMIGSELPWMALGYRESDKCAMTPSGGGDTEMILISADEEGDVGAHFTMLPPLAKSMNDAALSSIVDNKVPLDEKEGYSHVHLHLPSKSLAITKSAHSSSEDSLVLHFKQTMEDVPEVMHLMYAIGSRPEVGYHRTRKCFEVTEFPTCPSKDEKESTATAEEMMSPAGETIAAAELESASSAAGRTGTFAALVSGAVLALFVL